MSRHLDPIDTHLGEEGPADSPLEASTSAPTAPSPTGTDAGDRTKPRSSSSPFSAAIPLPLNLPFPTIPGLRIALLGYLGEVEASLRERLGRDVPVSAVERDEPEGSAGAGVASSTGWTGGDGSNELRFRGKGKGKAVASQADQDTTHTTDNGDITTSARPDPHRAVSSQDALLTTLSALREDVRAYLPSAAGAAAAVLSAPGSSREWLRTVPQRLMAVERSLRPSGSEAYLSPTDDWVDSRASSPGLSGDGDGDAGGAMARAKQKVMEMVRGVLPDDEWEGWERLGWEDTEMNGHQDRHIPLSSSSSASALGLGLGRARSRGSTLSFPIWNRSFTSLGLGSAIADEPDDGDGDSMTRTGASGRRRRATDGEEVTDEEDEIAEDEEQEAEDEADRYLFPNRTPAAAQAIADGRRRGRSKSLSSASHPGRSAADFGLTPMIPTGASAARFVSDSATMPGLQRMKTLPNVSVDVSRVPASTSLPEPEREDWKAPDAELERKQGLDEVKAEAADIVPPIKRSGPGLRIPDFASLAPGAGLGGGGRGLTPASALAPGGAASPLDYLISPAAMTPMSPLTAKLFGGEGLGPTVAEALRLSAGGKRLVRYQDLPFHWRNNEHIHTGYRYIPLHASTGPIPLIKSAFAWHNETINIQSHFIPTICILLFIPIMSYASPLPDAHPLDTAMLALYLLAAVACMSCSAGWHVLSGCASRKWFEWGACVDYIGISWLIAASFGTVVYNAFYCKPNAVFLYLGTNAACGALGSYLPFQRWFNLRRMKPYRIAFFLLLNFAMFAPMLQMFWKYGWHRGAAFVSPFVPSIMAYVSGLLFYGFHFPECFFPGKFDYIFASHQLWHTGIVTAIILHYRAVFVAHSVKYAYSCAAVDAGPPVSLVVEGWIRAFWGLATRAGSSAQV